jgi:hypothetical protein
MFNHFWSLLSSFAVCYRFGAILTVENVSIEGGTSLILVPSAHPENGTASASLIQVRFEEVEGWRQPLV